MTTELIVEFVSIAAIVMLAGASHSIIGFGFGIVVLAFLPSVVQDVRMAHIVLSLCSAPVLLMASWAYRKGIDWPSLWPALLGAAILMPIGLLAFQWMSMDWLVRGTGLAILLTTINSLRPKRTVKRADHSPKFPPQVKSFVKSFAAGAMGGFLGGAVSIAGPPVATYALNQDWSTERFKAFVTQCLLVICTYKIIGLAWNGLIETPDTIRAAWATPFAIIGIQVGVWLSRFIDPVKFKMIVAIVLIAIACLFLLRGSPPPERQLVVPGYLSVPTQYK